MNANLHITEIPSGYILSKDGCTILMSIPDIIQFVSKATTEHPEYFGHPAVSMVTGILKENSAAMDTAISLKKVANDANTVAMQIPEFVCRPGDPRVAKYGWKKSWFEGFLSLDGHTIWVSVVTSRRPGCKHFSKMIRSLHDAGFTIKVPMPSAHMDLICTHLGFEWTKERGDITGMMIPVWVLKSAGGDADVARKK